MIHSKAFNRLRRLLPRAENLVPHWIIEHSAQVEMDNFVLSNSKEWNKKLRKEHPLPPIMMEFSAYWSVDIGIIPEPIVLINSPKESAMFNYLQKINSHKTVLKAVGAPLDECDEVAFLIAENEGVEYDMSVSNLRFFVDQCAIYYAVRCHFAERYINKIKTFSGRSKPILDGIPGTSIITVKWDAPTPRVIGFDPEHVMKPTGIKMPEHSVRRHERHYVSGKVTFVKEHKRGDPKIERKTILRVV